MAKTLTVHRLSSAAALIGVSPPTLRKWDTSKKLPADKTATGERTYSDAHIERGKALKTASRAGR
jgi:DNA-binding transcriptional MerR regulator